MTADKKNAGLAMRSSSGRFQVPGRFSFSRIARMFLLACVLGSEFFFFSACALDTPNQSPVLNRPETKVFNTPSSVLMKALERVLAEKNFKINTARTSRQHIETDWLQDGSYRSMVLADVSALDKYRSQLSLQLVVQKKAFFQEVWQPLDEIDKTVYANFLNDVLIESYRVLYDHRLKF